MGGSGDTGFAVRHGGEKAAEGTSQDDERIAPGDIYATATGQRLSRPLRPPTEHQSL